jgi:hypothetical protein
MRATCPTHLILFESRSEVIWNISQQVKSLRWAVSPTPNPQTGGSPLVGCPQLLIRYIRSYPPYREASPSATWGRAIFHSGSFWEKNPCEKLEI